MFGSAISRPHPTCSGRSAATSPRRSWSPRYTRVVLEKPLGRDLASAQAINDAVAQFFAEEQTYRIDHYLGKETVQNLITLRFANFLFEPLWNSNAIDHVQITVAESLGVGDRVGYYDKSGALRDMVQNHILQLLCLVAMEPPSAFDADAVRDEKLKVLRALKPISAREVATATVRGQYRAGAVDGQAVPGYPRGAGPAAATPRPSSWSRPRCRAGAGPGVPFYLRTGKRLAARASEIIIQYRNVPLLDLQRGQPASGRQPPGAAAAARRGHEALSDEQGSRPRAACASRTSP